MVVQPFLAEDSLDDGVVLYGFFGGGHAARSLEAHALAGLLVILLDTLCHDVCGLKCGAGIFLAGGGLQEVGIAVQRQYRGVAYCLSGFKRSGFEDNLEYGIAGSLFLLGDFVTHALVVTIEEGANVEDDIDFVGTVFYGESRLGNLSLKEAL